MAISKILILDTETSGLDPAKDHLLEVGLVVWSLEHRTTLRSHAWIVRAPGNPAAEINGIPPGILASGERKTDVFARIEDLASTCDVIAAHNADFDRQWVPEIDRPWIDTCWDVEWPRASLGGDRRVATLCLAHGLGVIDAHRALPDCQMIARLLERVAELGQDVGRLLERAMRPKVEIVSLAPFTEKDVVKQHGFRWAPERKVWWRMMAVEDVAALPFRTRQLAAPTRQARAAAPRRPDYREDEQ